MKPWQFVSAIAGFGISVLGLGAIATNPTPEDYEDFAGQQLVTYLTEECRKATQEAEGFAKLLQGTCPTVVEAARPSLQQIVAENTQRQNYGLFSVYDTELVAPQFIPGAPRYQFKTVGIFQRFLVLKAEQQS